MLGVKRAQRGVQRGGVTYTCEGVGGGGGAFKASGSEVLFLSPFPPVALSEAFSFCALAGGFPGLSALWSSNGFFCVSIRLGKVELASPKRFSETIAHSITSLANTFNWNGLLILWTSPWRT